MVATIEIDESNTAGETITHGIANCNFGSNDSVNITPATYPVTAGQNSYEKFWKFHFQSTFNKVDNLRFWKSAGTIDTNADIKTCARTTSYTQQTFATPVATTSSKATQDIAEADPGAANLGIGGSLSGNLTSAGYSDYLVCQYQAASAHNPGDIAQLTLRFQYDEQ